MLQEMNLKVLFNNVTVAVYPREELSALGMLSDHHSSEE
jgi:hypothetical protein